MTQNTQDQEHRMIDETAPQDSAAMPPASAGSVASDIVGRLVAWRDERGFPTPGEMMDEAAAEIARLRLTDAEREAIDEAADTSDVAAAFYSGKYHALADAAAKHAATLRGLLERMGGGR